MKYTIILLLFLSLNSQAKVIQFPLNHLMNLQTGLGIPTNAGSGGGHRYVEEYGEQRNPDIINYVGLNLLMTDTFGWLDFGNNPYYQEFSDTSDGDFEAIFSIDNIEIGRKLILEPKNEIFGLSWFNSEPLGIDTGGQFFFSVSFRGYHGNGNPATTDFKIALLDTGNLIYASDDTMFAFVPEPETFSLFLFGVFGVCIRRQIKGNLIQRANSTPKCTIS